MSSQHFAKSGNSTPTCSSDCASITQILSLSTACSFLLQRFSTKENYIDSLLIEIPGVGRSRALVRKCLRLRAGTMGFSFLFNFTLWSIGWCEISANNNLKSHSKLESGRLCEDVFAKLKKNSKHYRSFRVLLDSPIQASVCDKNVEVNDAWQKS